MPAGYTKEDKERIMDAAYEIYKIDRKSVEDAVSKFIEQNPWAKIHENLVFTYVRTMIDYRVLCELSSLNDIRLRNQLITSIDKLHKQLYSYMPGLREGKDLLPALSGGTERTPQEDYRDLFGDD